MINQEKYFRTLLHGCKKNDRKAQEKLYRHFYPKMEAMVRRHSIDQDQIISIINDGFLRVFQKIDQFKFQGSLEGWIRRIVYHSISDYFRKNKKDIKFLIFDETPAILQENVNSKLYFEDLMSLIEKLPEMHHKVFYMFAIDGYKHKEIADILDINLNTSKWYLAKAKEILKNEIEELRKNRYA